MKNQIDHLEEVTESYYKALVSSNPFSSNRVNDPSEENVDVAEINGKQFLDLVSMVKETLNENSSRGVLLLGGSGVGKSHLLARLAEWCCKGDNPGIFVFLHNLMASPNNVAHYFVYYVMCMMTKATDTFHDSMLYQIMKKVTKLAHKQAKIEAQTTPEKSHKALIKYFTGLNIKPDPINHQVFEVLFNFFRIVNMNPDIHGSSRDEVIAIIDWLSGNPIGEESALNIGLNLNSASKNEDDQFQIRDNEAIKQVLLILTTLAAEAEKSFVICIDQIDNLHEDQVKEICRFLHAVIDHAKNLFVIVSGVNQSVRKFIDHQVIPEATLDRIGETIIELNRVTIGEAKQIVSKRLNVFLEKFEQIPKVLAYKSQFELYPLSVTEFEKYIGDRIEIRPRDVISWARDSWRSEQKRINQLGFQQWIDNWPTDLIPPVSPIEINDIIDQTIQARISEAVSKIREQKGVLPPEADNLATLVHELLNYCVKLGQDYSVKSVKRINGKTPSYHLEVVEEKKDSSRILNGISFITSTKGSVSAPALKRLLKVTTKLDHRILVTDEERAPLGNSKTVVETYTELKKMGDDKFIHIKLNFEQYATLDALYNVLANSKNGDIEIYHPSIGNKVITFDETLQSMHRLDLFRKHPLLQELLMEPVKEIILPPVELEEADVRKLVLGWLAFNLCVTTNKLVPQFLDTYSDYKIENNECHTQINAIALRMQQENVIIAKDYNGTLLLSKPA